MTHAKIRLDGVTKIFGRGDTRRTVELVRRGADKAKIREETGQVVGVADATCEIRTGETFVVMGLSGSGKSTLIRCVNRLIEPTSGSVWIDDEDVCAADKDELLETRRRKIGMVFQHFGLFPHRTVRDNAAYGLKVRGVAEKERAERAQEALELVGLGAWGDYRPANLSGGMQQRVGLARALATDPDILLMDEAFSALDPLIKRQMQNELMQLQERVRKTILFITHDLNEALRIGDRIAIMKGGRFVQIGTPTEIVTEPRDEYVADFVQDVDQGRVLQVNFVMSDAPVLRLGQAGVKQALDRVRGLDTGGLYVVDHQRHPIGLVTVKGLAEAEDRGVDDLDEVMLRDFPVTYGDTSISEIYELCSDGWPVAVLSRRDGKLEGVVDPLDLLGRLGAVEHVEAIGEEQPGGLAEPDIEEPPGEGEEVVPA
ncbi:MAG: quaternary amine ABC transporter ATP-binding protein [Nitriliruptorales bacterium]